jgi:hypothetical protein
MGKYISLKEIKYRKTKLEEQKQQLEDKARKENLEDCSYTWTMYRNLTNRILELDYLIDFIKMKEEQSNVK